MSGEVYDPDPECDRHLCWAVGFCVCAELGIRRVVTVDVNEEYL